MDKFDHLIEQTDDGDAIQTGVFTIAKENGMAPKDFFRLLYGVLLGAESGPRIGGFVKLVGKDRVRELISKARAAQQA